MSLVSRTDWHTGLAETTLKGIVEGIATYEVADDTLIIRTSTHGTPHITCEIGRGCGHYCQ